MAECNADFELNLKSLKRFHVNTLSDGIRLNTPNLSEISFRLFFPSFHPPTLFKQIRKLTCFYANTRHQPIWIKKLENLESLYCNSFFDEFDPVLLGYFPRLKFLYLYCCERENARRIEAEKIRLRRKDLKIYYFGKIGLKCFDMPWASLLNWSIYEMYNVLADYYRGDLAELAPILPTAFALNFDDRFRNYDLRFYKRLTNVQVLYITQGPMSQAELIQLIGWLKNIVILWMNEATHVDQRFFDLLPDHYPYLRWIHIDNRELANLNLNFLFRLDHLYKLEFERPSSVETNAIYDQLVEKVENQRKKIAEINGNLLFEIDVRELHLVINEYLNDRRRAKSAFALRQR